MTAIPAETACEGEGRKSNRLAEFDARVSVLLRAIAFRPYAGTAALALLCCLFFLPGIVSLPVTDRDEARFAQATKQMLESGDAIDIRFQDEPRYKKPIGIYWLQSAAVFLASKAGAALDDIWAYRVPSFLGALASVLVTFWASRAIIGRESALIASAILAACLLISFESRIAKSDAALLAAIALAQGTLFRLYMARPGQQTRGLAALFWLGLGTGLLIKGPVAPGLAVATIAAVLIFKRSRSWLQHLHWRWGIPLFLLLTLPWFVAIGIASHGEFFKSSLGDDFAAKIQAGQEAHGAPPGFYFALFWLTFWPATLFVTFDGIKRLWRMRKFERTFFLLAWIVPWWLIIEAISTKLPHYALPLYPALAVAAVTASQSWSGPNGVRTRLAVAIWSIAATLLAIFLLVLSWIAEAPQTGLLAVMLAALAAAAILTAVASWRGLRYAALIGVLASAGLFYTAAFRIALPGLKPVWISETAAAAARMLAGCYQGPPGFSGFSAPSLVFLNGTKTVLTSPAGLAGALQEKTAGIAFVNWKQRVEFERVYEQKTGTPPRFIGCADGVDINGKGPTRLQIYVDAAATAGASCVPPSAMACAPRENVRWRRLLNSPF